jgi:hypothetical protein
LDSCRSRAILIGDEVMARVGDYVFGKQNCLPVGLPKPEFTDLIVAVNVS